MRRPVKNPGQTWTHSRNVEIVHRRRYNSVAYGHVMQRIKVHQDGDLYWATLESENPYDDQLSSPYYTSRELAAAHADSYREYFN